jgi:hypothetical protein
MSNPEMLPPPQAGFIVTFYDCSAYFWTMIVVPTLPRLLIQPNADTPVRMLLMLSEVFDIGF